MHSCESWDLLTQVPSSTSPFFRMSPKNNNKKNLNCFFSSSFSNFKKCDFCFIWIDANFSMEKKNRWIHSIFNTCGCPRANDICDNHRNCKTLRRLCKWEIKLFFCCWFKKIKSSFTISSSSNLNRWIYVKFTTIVIMMMMIMKRLLNSKQNSFIH